MANTRFSSGELVTADKLNTVNPSIISTGGSEDRTLADRAADVAHVSDYGSVQAALDSTAKVVVFEEGTSYAITSELPTAVENRTIIGYGATLTSTSAVGGENVVIAVKAHYTSIYGLTITGNSASNGIGIEELAGVSDFCRIEGCNISGFTDGGAILTRNTPKGHFIVNNVIDNCEPGTAGGQYGSIQCNASGSVVSGNRITTTKQTGISVQGGGSGSNNIRIANNFIEWDGGSSTDSGGIIIDGTADSCVISGNTILGGRVEGIQIATSGTYVSSNHVIANNVVKDCDVSGITLYSATTVGNLRRIMISGNMLSYEGSPSGSPASAGLELVGGKFVNFSANYVNGYDKGVAVATPSPDITINGNTFNANATVGIQIHGHYWNVTGNQIEGVLATTSGLTFNATTTAGNQLVEGNLVKNCATGIVGTFDNANPVFIRNNYFFGNTADYTYSGDRPDNSRDNIFDTTQLSGEATLVAGSANVTTTRLLDDDEIVLALKTAGGTPGAPYIYSKNAGGELFTIKSTNGSDTSIYYWQIMR